MILITGATGFLGSELAMQLARQGMHIRCIKRSTSVVPDILQPYKNNINWFDADILNIAELEYAFTGITRVYHCAAQVSFNEANREAIINNNVQGTVNVITMCKRFGARLLHVSSVATLGLAKKGELVTEDHLLDPNKQHDAYASSKLKSEAQVWQAINEGLNAVIVNPSIIIGVNSLKKGSGQIFQLAGSGTLFYPVGGNGFVDVEDVAKCMQLLMDSGITGQRYIINTSNLSYKHLIYKVAKALQATTPKIPIMPWAFELVWRGAKAFAGITKKAPIIDSATARSLSARYYYNTQKIEKAIHIEFKPIDQTINEICAKLKR